jgi:hypothetical protein
MATTTPQLFDVTEKEAGIFKNIITCSRTIRGQQEQISIYAREIKQEWTRRKIIPESFTSVELAQLPAVPLVLENTVRLLGLSSVKEEAYYGLVTIAGKRTPVVDDFALYEMTKTAIESFCLTNELSFAACKELLSGMNAAVYFIKTTVDRIMDAWELKNTPRKTRKPRTADELKKGK